MIYMGCVTDWEWKLALCEQYPNRKAHSQDTKMRARISAEHRDLPELARKFINREPIARYYKS